VSVGLTTWQALGERGNLARLGQRLLQCADEAMYQAKHSGRNQVAIKPFCQIVSAPPLQGVDAAL
jgi:GGDEF domain-containing protein